MTRPEAPAGVSRLFLAEDSTLAAHLSAYGESFGSADLIAEVHRAGLTGRGGAGFPAAAKIRSVTGGRSRPVVVANGSEGEPASDKDRTLLTHAPHLVLDGLALVSDAVRARAAHLVTADRRLADDLQVRVDEREDRRTPGVSVVPDRFIAGEESAVVAFLSGREPLPADRLVRVFERGVDGRPTVVLNVETLAHIALIARFGADWFAAQGEPGDAGTFLATVGGDAERPGVYEVARGTSLAQLLDIAGSTAPQAVLVGGYHGTWVPGAAVASARLSSSGLAAYDARVGAGIVVPLPAHRCGLVESARIARYLAAEVAGQCGPCVNGLPRMADTLERLASGDSEPDLPQQVERLRSLVTGRGACAHPDGTARFVASAMRIFADDVHAHQQGGCRALSAHRLDPV